MNDLPGTSEVITPSVPEIRTGHEDYSVSIAPVDQGTDITLQRKNRPNPDITVASRRQETPQSKELEAEITNTVTIVFKKNGLIYRLTACDKKPVLRLNVKSVPGQALKQTIWQLGEYKLKIQQHNEQWQDVSSQVKETWQFDQTRLAAIKDQSVLSQPMHIAKHWINALNHKHPQVGLVVDSLIKVRNALTRSVYLPQT